MRDPYIYPGTDTLINKFDIQDADKLQDLEAAIYRLKITEPLPDGRFDYEHLKSIHQHLFGDLYSWAGQERTVDISKGHSQFARQDFISAELNKIFTQLKTDNYLRDLSSDDFFKKLSYYFNEINAAHPFREGNGRTLRAFCDVLAEQAGYQLDWTKIQTQEYMQANVLGFNGQYEGMEAVFKKIASPMTRTNTLEIEGLELKSHTLDILKDYVNKQIQLTALITQKNSLLVHDPARAKELGQEAVALSNKLKETAKMLVTVSEVQQILKKPTFTTLQKQGGFSAISNRLQKKKTSLNDVLAIVRHAKNHVQSVSQSLGQSRGRAGQY